MAAAVLREKVGEIHANPLEALVTTTSLPRISFMTVAFAFDSLAPPDGSEGIRCSLACGIVDFSARSVVELGQRLNGMDSSLEIDIKLRECGKLKVDIMKTKVAVVLVITLIAIVSGVLCVSSAEKEEFADWRTIPLTTGRVGDLRVLCGNLESLVRWEREGVLHVQVNGMTFIRGNGGFLASQTIDCSEHPTLETVFKKLNVNITNAGSAQMRLFKKNCVIQSGSYKMESETELNMRKSIVVDPGDVLIFANWE